MTNGEKIRDASESLINTVTDAVNGTGNANSYIDKNVLGGASTPADATGAKVNVMESRNMADKFSKGEDVGRSGFEKMPAGNNKHFNKQEKQILTVALIKQGLKWTENLADKFHYAIKHLKDVTGNVPKEDLIKAAKEFAIDKAKNK